MTLVIAVGVQDRPALAPAGEFDLGFYAIGSPTFLTGMSATLIVSRHLPILLCADS
jgi:hypothetical protein